MAAAKKQKKTRKTPTKKKARKTKVVKKKTAQKPSYRKQKTSKKAPAKKKATRKKTPAAKKKIGKKNTPAKAKKATRKPRAKQKASSEVPTSNSELAALFAADQAEPEKKKFFGGSKPPGHKSAQATGGPDEIKQKPRWGAIITAFSVLLIAMVYYTIQYKVRASLPRLEGEVKIAGLEAGVSINRDKLGIPLIEASNEKDLMFATGYAQAADRLWQMHTLKMLGAGRISEVVGERALPVDIYMRTIGTHRQAQNALKALPPRLLGLLQRFADGVNHYVKTNKLPVEFMLTGYEPEEWRPLDSLLVFSSMNLSLAANLNEELGMLTLLEKIELEKIPYLFPTYDDEPLPFDQVNKLKEFNLTALSQDIKNWQQLHASIDEYLPSGLPASNNWAVAPVKTRGGKSIVANDTHLELTIPSAWMIMHLKSPQYQAAGVMAPGIPLVTLGYNGNIAWGATMVMADNQDIFLEKLKTENGKSFYQYGEQWLPVRVEKEEFKIKGEEPVSREIKFTRNGPLLNDAIKGRSKASLQPEPATSSYGLAYRSSSIDADRSALGFYNMGRAKTMAEARYALSFIDSIYLNIVYGDADNIAWQVTGRIPIRAPGYSGKFVTPGFIVGTGWQGYVDYYAKPASLNPPAGFIATANNKITPAGYPHRISSSFYSRERAERAEQLLGRMTGITVDEMHKMHFDRVSLLARKVIRRISQKDFYHQLTNAIKKQGDDAKEDALEALTTLEKFDGNMHPGSRAAAIYGAFLSVATRKIFQDELAGKDSHLWQTFVNVNKRSYGAPQDHLLFRDDSPFWDDVTTKEKENMFDIYASALAGAIRLCEDKMGSNRKNWEWGRLHTYHWQHGASRKSSIAGYFLDRGPYPAGGSLHTLNVSGFRWGDSFDTYLIPAMRLVVDFNQADPAYLVTHGGQSGNPASDHYDDMIPYFLTGKNHRLPFNEENIKKQYTKKLHLVKAAN